MSSHARNLRQLAAAAEARSRADRAAELLIEACRSFAGAEALVEASPPLPQLSEFGDEISQLAAELDEALSDHSFHTYGVAGGLFKAAAATDRLSDKLHEVEERLERDLERVVDEAAQRG